MGVLARSRGSDVCFASAYTREGACGSVLLAFMPLLPCLFGMMRTFVWLQPIFVKSAVLFKSVINSILNCAGGSLAETKRA